MLYVCGTQFVVDFHVLRILYRLMHFTESRPHFYLYTRTFQKYPTATFLVYKRISLDGELFLKVFSEIKRVFTQKMVSHEVNSSPRSYFMHGMLRLSNPILQRRYPIS
jgi:hypothetical protein